MSACIPPSSDELLSAICIYPDENSVNFENKVTESSLLALCNNLLVFDSQREGWRFSHLSVVEYFEANHWSLRQAHSNAAKLCLKFLIETYGSPTYESDIKSSGDKYKINPPNKFGVIHPLETYVQHHWVIHVTPYEDLIAKESQEVDPLLERLLKSFLGSPGESSIQYRAWYRSLGSEDTSPPSSFLRERGKFNFGVISKEDISPEEVTICAMCRFPFYILLRDWWDNAEFTVSQTNWNRETLLILAVKARCKPICEILIKRGIEPNLVLSKNRYGSALATAAWGGHKEIVDLLIENGADVNLISGDYGSALAAAALSGYKNIVNILIEHGADVNLLLPSGNYGSALAAAAWGEDKEIVDLLIEEGADLNLALSIAASRGDKHIMELLVEHKADAIFVSSS